METPTEYSMGVRGPEMVEKVSNRSGIHPGALRATAHAAAASRDLGPRGS